MKNETLFNYGNMRSGRIVNYLILGLLLAFLGMIGVTTTYVLLKEIVSSVSDIGGFLIYFFFIALVADFLFIKLVFELFNDIKENIQAKWAFKITEKGINILNKFISWNEIKEITCIPGLRYTLGFFHFEKEWPRIKILKKDGKEIETRKTNIIDRLFFPQEFKWKEFFKTMKKLGKGKLINPFLGAESVQEIYDKVFS